MKNTSWPFAKLNCLIFAVFLFFNISCISQSQFKLNRAAKIEYMKVDSELNDLYKKIYSEYESDTTFIKKLKKSQKIWISFRDAELDMKFPKKDKPVEYGSVYPMCESLFLKKMTNERIEKLKVWIDGIAEGEVCLGSAKMK